MLYFDVATVIRKLPFVTLILALTLLFAPRPGVCSVSLMPMEARLKMPATGTRLTDEIEVLNSGDKPVHVTASIMDWTLDEQGNYKFLEPGTTPRSCASWIQLNPMSFAVPAQKSVRVRYSITAPAEVNRELWAMVFFQTRAFPVKGDKNGLSININTRIGCKIFLAPSRPVESQGKIVDMELSPIPTAELEAAKRKAEAQHAADNKSTPSTPQEPLGNARVKVVFENTGISHLRLSGTVEVTDKGGALIAKGTFPERSQILSESRREVWAQLDKPLLPGAYHVKAVVDCGARQLVGGELDSQFTPPPDAPRSELPVSGMTPA